MNVKLLNKEDFKNECTVNQLTKNVLYRVVEANNPEFIGSIVVKTSECEPTQVVLVVNNVKKITSEPFTKTNVLRNNRFEEVTEKLVLELSN